MSKYAPSLFDFQVDDIERTSPITLRRKRGRPKLAPLPQGTGELPTKALCQVDALMSRGERRESLRQWVVKSTRKPNRRDYTRAVLQMLADHADLDPESPTYLQCLALKQGKIADRVGISRVSVSRVMRRLEGVTLISSTRVSRTVTRYTLFAAPLRAHM